MFLRHPTLVLSLVLAGGAAADEKCFCPVENLFGASGRCGGRGSYEQLEAVYGNKLVCQDLCAQDAPKCKAFTFFPTKDGDGEEDCYLYDYVPSGVERVDEDDEAASCVAATGTDGGFVEVPRKTTGPQGGKCRAPVYSGTSSCGGPNKEPYCVYKTKAANVDECKDWCAARGNSCQGFDFDQGQAERDQVSCIERRFEPDVGYAPSSRKDYTDWFCHARVCDCDGGSGDENLCDGFLEPDDLIAGDEVCENTPDKCVATAKLNKNKSCDEWCALKGLRCTKAWNDGKEDCEKKREIDCAVSKNKHSICQCEP